MILLDGQRQNHIVAVYGANGACDDAQVKAAKRAMDGADALLLQQEIPLGVSLAAANAVWLISRANKPAWIWKSGSPVNWGSGGKSAAGWP